MTGHHISPISCVGVFYLTVVALTSYSRAEALPNGGFRRGASSGNHWEFAMGDPSKFFPFFPIVRIDNSPCIPELANTMGTCFTRSQCRAAGGTISGSCASGFGVCCVVTATCDSIISQNNTVYQNRNYPSNTIPTGLEICTVRVQKPSPSVCQIHLEFTSAQFSVADKHGMCTTDRFTINGVTSPPTNLCGNLTGQHMYLNFGKNDRFAMSVVMDGDANQNERGWNIKTKFIECTSIERAPQGCLQYYTSPSDEVRILGHPMVPHLANLDYTVCVRNEEDAGSITWSPCANQLLPQNFAMTGNINASQMAAEPCNEDYVLIMTDDASSLMPKRDDRYCGMSLIDSRLSPQLVRSFAHPFIMRVKTDATETEADADNVGFCLTYRQEPPTRGR